MQRNREKFMAEHIVERSNHTVENGRLSDIEPRNGENVADQHVFEVFAFGSGFAHRQNRSCRSHRVANTDDCLLGTTRPTAADGGKDEGSKESERKTHPVSYRRVGIAACYGQ